MVVEPIRQYQESKSHVFSQTSQKKSQIIDVLAQEGHPENLNKQIPFYKVLSGSMEEATLDRLRLLMTSDGLWRDLMSAAEHTLVNTELAFRMIAMAGSKIVGKLLFRHKLQPNKTLLVDLTPDFEAEIVNNSCDHMHTPWSLEHCAAHLGNVSAEARRDGRAKRVHIADNSTSTIMELENLHAAFRRKLKTAGVQTQKVTFPDLAAGFVCDRARSRESQHSWRDTAAPANNLSVEDCDAVPGAGEAPVANDGNDRDYERGGGGGLWRAFIRDQTLGTSGAPDLRALADQYNNHTTEAELDRLRPIAAEATDRHASGENTSGSKTSSFGPTSREVERALLKRKADLMYQKLSDEAKNSLAIEEYDAGGQPLQAALEAAHTERQLRGGTFDAALKEGRFVLQSYTKMKNRRIKELGDMVRKWCADNCSQLLDALVGQLPLLHQLRADTVALPPRQGFMVFNYRPEIEKLVAASTSIYEKGRGMNNLSSMMQTRFKQRCSPFLHADACKQCPIPAKPRQPPCFRYGRILCKGDGLQIWSMRNSLLKCMKEIFKPKTALRSKLGTSHIAAMFVGKGEPITNPWAKKDALAQGRRVDGIFQERLFLISHMSFNPYCPSWMEVHRKVDDALFCKLVPGSLPITCNKYKYYDELDGIAQLDRSLVWTVQWYSTAANHKHVANFVPGNQHLVPLVGSAPVQFWPRVRDCCVFPCLVADGDFSDAEEAALALEDEGEPDDPDDQPAGDELLGEVSDSTEDEADAGDPRAVTAALAKVTLANDATIAVYRDGRFEAVCRHAMHLPRGRCRLTRTSYGTGTEACPAQGRPLGLLTSWLLAQDNFHDREDHCDAFAVYSQSYEDRCLAREQLKLVPGAAELFVHERARRAGENEEPEEWP